MRLMNGLRSAGFLVVGVVSSVAVGQPCECSCPEGQYIADPAGVTVDFEEKYHRAIFDPEDNTVFLRYEIDCVSEGSGEAEVCSNCTVGGTAEVDFTDSGENTTNCTTALTALNSTRTVTAVYLRDSADGPVWSVTVSQPGFTLFNGVVDNSGDPLNSNGSPSPGGSWTWSTTCNSVSAIYNDDDSVPGEHNDFTTRLVTLTITPAKCVEIMEGAPASCPQVIIEDEGDDDDEGCEFGDHSDDPVHNLLGSKIERNVDIVVPLPGRDFKLIREYNSNPDNYFAYDNGEYYWNGMRTFTRPGFVGAQWDFNAMKGLFGGDIGGGIAYSLTLTGFPTSTTR